MQTGGTGLLRVDGDIKIDNGQYLRSDRSGGTPETRLIGITSDNVRMGGVDDLGFGSTIIMQRGSDKITISSTTTTFNSNNVTVTDGQFTVRSGTNPSASTIGRFGNVGSPAAGNPELLLKTDTSDRVFFQTWDGTASRCFLYFDHPNNKIQASGRFDHVGLIAARPAAETIMDTDGGLSDTRKIVFNASRAEFGYEADVGPFILGGAGKSIVMKPSGSQTFILNSDGSAVFGAGNPGGSMLVRFSEASGNLLRLDNSSITDLAWDVRINGAGGLEFRHVNDSGTTQIRALKIDPTTGNVTSRQNTYLMEAENAANALLSVRRAANSNYPQIVGQRGRGDLTTPTAVQNNNVMTEIGGGGYGTSWSPFRGGMRVSAAENWTGSAHGTYVELRVTPAGGTTQIAALRCQNSGNIDMPNENRARAFNIISTGNHAHSFNFDSNRSSSNSALGSIVGKWNGDSVAAIILRSGTDTTNKDDGRIIFQTQATNAGGLVTHLQLMEDGDFEVLSTAYLDIKRPVALGGGAAPTLGTIGGSGPATAAQNEWVEIKVNGNVRWIPVWA
jgi:hypothetical protein